LTYAQKYISRFKNVENQTVIVRIEDRLSGVVNPYSINYTSEDAGGGNQTLLIYFSDLPADADNIRLAYSADGGATFSAFTDYPIPPSVSPIAYTIPNGNYLYILQVQYSDPFEDDEQFILNDLNGITDELEAAGDPLHLIVNNNGQSKIDSPVFAMQCVFKFNSDAENNLNKLVRGTYSDRRYFMTVAINEEDLYVFKGFVSLSDCGEAFMPHRNVVSLTATDQLAALKNKTLKDFNDANPTYENKIIDYIAWCLRLTGLEENINVVMNIRSEFAGTIAAAPGEHLYVTEFLDAKTFELEIGESEDCYTVLQKILKHTCYIGQRHGQWWIKNVDEFDAQPDYVAVFNSAGEFQEMREGAYYTKEIGGDYAMFWSNESALVTFASPAKFAKDTYRYENWKELICNMDFSRGVRNPSLDGTGFEAYTLECWESKKANYPTSDLIAATTDIFMKKVLVDGYEKERYVVIKASASPSNVIYSEPMKMLIKDKFSLSISKRLSGDVGGSGSDITIGAQVRLYGNDGTYWTLDGGTSVDPTVEWVACTSTFTTFQKTIDFEQDASEDQTAIQTASVDAPPLPVSGSIRILLYQDNNHGSTYDTYIYAPTFEYLPFINGNYQKYSGHYHKVSRVADNIESVDEEVYVGDAPVPAMKGALLRYNGTGYELSGRYWNAAVYPGGVPSDDYYHPFGYIQAFNVWNQCRLSNRIFSGTVQGIDSDKLDGLFRSDLPTVFHTYYLRDLNEHSTDKKFMCVGYNMDLYLCEWTPTLREVMDENQGKAYNDSYEFKYITR
jgi:hypothetical protein